MPLNKLNVDWGTSWSYILLDLQLLVQSVPITTKVVSSNPVYGEVYLIQHYEIKFVSDLRQVGGFFRVIGKMKFQNKNIMFVFRWSLLLQQTVIIIVCVCVFQFPYISSSKFNYHMIMPINAPCRFVYTYKL